VTKPIRDLAVSIRQRLNKVAKERRRPAAELLQYFAMERFLYRLAQSPHRDHFMLKGAMLFAAWTKIPHRATRELDLLGTGKPELARIAAIFRDIVGSAVEPDDVTFDADTVQAARTKEDQHYEGVRVTLNATLGSARIGVQIDISFGDAVYPGPVTIDYPSLLGLPTARLLAYPRECVVAEKFHAVVRSAN
jgi:hypothetical protein